MAEKGFSGLYESTKRDHSELGANHCKRTFLHGGGCVQKTNGEDLVQLNGGSGSSEHIVWGHRAQPDWSEQGPANNAIPIPPSYIQFAA